MRHAEPLSDLQAGARRLEFRFLCGQPDCAHHAACHLARPHHVTLGHRRPELTAAADLLERRGEIRDAWE